MGGLGINTSELMLDGGLGKKWTNSMRIELMAEFKGCQRTLLHGDRLEWNEAKEPAAPARCLTCGKVRN